MCLSGSPAAVPVPARGGQQPGAPAPASCPWATAKTAWLLEETPKESPRRGEGLLAGHRGGAGAPPHKPRGSLEPSCGGGAVQGWGTGRGRDVARGLGTLAQDGEKGRRLLDTGKEDGVGGPGRGKRGQKLQAKEGAGSGVLPK